LSNDNSNLDPEIAELLGISLEPEEKPIEFSDTGKPINRKELKEIDLTKILKDSGAYNRIISEAGEYGARFHNLLVKYTKSVDKDEKSVYREKLIPAYWNMLTALIDNLFDNLTDEKQALFRYGLLKSSFIDDTQKEVLLHINKNPKIPDYYFIDEWLLMVGNGTIKQSAVDETIKMKKKSPSFVREKLERKLGSKEAELASLKQKVEQHEMLEKSLKSSVSIILNHERLPEYGNIIAPYTNEQKKALSQMQDIIKDLLKSDREIEGIYRQIRYLEDEIIDLKQKAGEVVEELNTKTVREEFMTVRQMIKMTVGRQGNHFPFLIKSYMPKNIRDVGDKETVNNILTDVERIDPGIFIRRYKKNEHRIVPHIIIVPSYGDFGICWEPFERVNRATSKGRLAIPMFPRDIKTAILYALGDLRWQIAKEKALHHWMEEGLTGHYYDYIQSNKIKGDLKESFIQDYILWIKHESQGLQKLHKDVREIFWRYIPFPQELKEMLKNRGYYYAELYKKDQNRALSRGY